MGKYKNNIISIIISIKAFYLDCVFGDIVKFVEGDVW